MGRPTSADPIRDASRRRDVCRHHDPRGRPRSSPVPRCNLGSCSRSSNGRCELERGSGRATRLARTKPRALLAWNGRLRGRWSCRRPGVRLPVAGAPRHSATDAGNQCLPFRCEVPGRKCQAGCAWPMAQRRRHARACQRAARRGGGGTTGCATLRRSGLREGRNAIPMRCDAPEGLNRRAEDGGTERAKATARAARRPRDNRSAGPVRAAFGSTWPAHPCGAIQQRARCGRRAAWDMEGRCFLAAESPAGPLSLQGVGTGAIRGGSHRRTGMPASAGHSGVQPAARFKAGICRRAAHSRHLARSRSRCSTLCVSVLNSNPIKYTGPSLFMCFSA